MTVYLIVFTVVSVCAILSCTQISAKIKDSMYWGCAGGLVLLSAIRDLSVGADTLVYCEEFHTIRGLTFLEAMHFRWEQGYVAVNWLLGNIFQNERFFIIAMACIILIPIFVWIKRESEWPILSLVVFVGMGMWNLSMTHLRQWCAVAILTFSYKYVKERKFIWFLVFLCIAALFHRTAIAFVLVYFVTIIPINKRTLLAAVPLAAIEGIFGEEIMNLLNRFARIGEVGSYNGGIKMLIVLWGCVFIAYVFFEGKIPKKMQLWFRMVFLAAFLQPIVFTFSNWSRVVAYFSVSLIIFFPDFIMEWTEERTSRLPSTVIVWNGKRIDKVKQRLLLGTVLCVLMFIWFCMTIDAPYAFMPF